MTRMIATTTIRKSLNFLLACTFLLALTALAQAQTYIDNPDIGTTVVSGYGVKWATAASTGTVDQHDLISYSDNPVPVDMRGAKVYLSSYGVPFPGAPAYAALRYHILGAPDLANKPYWDVILNYRTPYYSRVTVTLNALDLFTGNVTTLGTFDSNRYAPSGQFTRRGLRIPMPAGRNFSNTVFYLRADLQKTDSYGDPALASIEVRSF